MKNKKVCIVTLGCSKNLVDSERLMRQFAANGFTLEHDPPHIHADIVVVNTCAFIGDAQEESVNMILDLCEAKKEGKISKLYVMGCLSERFFDELKQEIPEVDHFYGKFNWTELITDLGETYHPELAAERILTTLPHYAYIKIAEGCNRTCSYCSIPAITGHYQSQPIEKVVAEVQHLVEKGVKEFQLIAQDLTYYGKDLYGKLMLPELVERLSDIEGVKWLRLHYAYPSQFPWHLLDVMRERENVCNYLDIALQHISDPMLKLMRRKITKSETYGLLQRLREEVPGIHLRTTLMVGHPGETDEYFQELVQFVKDIRFERMGAFVYSHETGTYAYRHYKDEIPEEVKQARLDELMTVQERIAFEINSEKVGKTFKVVVDREEPEYYVGRTAYDSPDVDNEVLISKETVLQPGQFYSVRIESAETFDLYGTVTG